MVKAFLNQPFSLSLEVGELTNINLFGRVLDNSEMEAVTLCQDHLDGDLVEKIFCEKKIFQSHNHFGLKKAGRAIFFNLCIFIGLHTSLS